MSTTLVQKKEDLSIEDQKKVELIRKLIAPEATNEELQLFLYRAKKLGLDPLSGQIHFVKRRRKNSLGEWEDIATIHIGIDGFRLIAERSGQYDGQDPIKFVVKRQHQIVETLYTLPEDEPVAAIANVYRKGIVRPFVGVAHYREYVQKTADGRVTPMWQKWNIMLGKCAEAIAFRKAFPDIFSGIYEKDEIPVEPVESENETISPLQNVNTTTATDTATPASQKVNKHATDNEKTATVAQVKAIKQMFKKAGHDVDEDLVKTLTFNTASEVIKMLNQQKFDDARALLAEEEPF